MENNIGYPNLINTSGGDRSTDKDANMLWKAIVSVLTYNGIIYVPAILQNQVRSLFHNTNDSNHIGEHKITANLIGTATG
jgi:hypothetical protein